MLPKPDCVFSIPSLHDDLELDGRLYFPRPLARGSGPVVRGFAILAHPYAPLGGSLDDPVVQTVGSVLLKSGLVLNTFNFRGAGGSAGSTSWTGKAEVGDFVSFYSLILYMINQPGVVEQIAPATMNEKRSAPLVVLGGYSFGSMIASNTPNLDAIRGALISSQKDSMEHEIQVRASELAKTLLGYLETRDWRGRNSVQSTGSSNTNPSSLGVILGGYDSELAGHRISQESSRRSLDLGSMRRSIDRVRHKLGSRNNSPPGDIPEADQPETGGPVSLSISPSLAYLLISPLLPPVSGFLTLFSRPNFVFRHQQGATPVDQQFLNLSQHDSLALFGSKDIFTSARKLRKWSDDNKKVTNSKFQYKEIDGAGHFWREHGVETTLCNEIFQWVQGLTKD